MKKAVADPIAEEYAKLLHAALGDRLREVWLFGSRARGDFTEDSDYDVVVIAEGDQHEVNEIAGIESYAIMSEYSEFVGQLVYSPDEWEMTKHTSLGRNVLREGILVYGQE